MPKVKRFQNPLKSPQGSHDAHGSSSSSTTPARSHAIEPSTLLQAPPPAPANSSLADEVLPQQEAPTQPSNPRATVARLGRASTQYWRVEAIDSNNVTKMINVKANEVNNLPTGERIIVNFDYYGAAYGEAQGLLAGYCGLLAIDGNLFPINFDRWSGPSGLPKKYMEDCFETLLKPRFFFRTTDAISYRYCNCSLNKKWATHRQRLWEEFYDPAKCRNEILRNVPVGIYRDQWAGFVAYRLKEETIELCRRNKEIRRKQKIPHTGGSKANSRRRHELLLETGQNPSRGKMFIETHKRKDGSFVNDEARTIVEQIQLNQGSESEISANDNIGKVLGAEHSGRVRCMGMGATPSNTFNNFKRRLNGLNTSTSSFDASSATSTYLHQKVARLESQLEGTLTALKDYMISKEGGVPEEFVDLFAPQPQPSDDDGSEPTSPANIRGSSGDINGNDQANT
ncbi:uncharacterized protein LOC132042860 isoform X2 [Lycium ferocissimum]|uniref:uncharacterized protein LOC132042860 isoform X2 n=1 Tax=Lycium ferocissimum TaxID=112874 RepID=UPI002815E512|nr:uncharacterized protein LOC132042860 isoform X2 [Lycium ferocissimum]